MFLWEIKLWLTVRHQRKKAENMAQIMYCSSFEGPVIYSQRPVLLTFSLKHPTRGGVYTDLISYANHFICYLPAYCRRPVFRRM
jgi:hypothetical protein